jgi:hypothetical protein
MQAGTSTISMEERTELKESILISSVTSSRSCIRGGSEIFFFTRVSVQVLRHWQEFLAQSERLRGIPGHP